MTVSVRTQAHRAPTRHAELIVRGQVNAQGESGRRGIGIRPLAARTLVLVVLLHIATAGCSTTWPWHQHDETTPWIAPGRRATAFVRNVEPGILGPAQSYVLRDTLENRSHDPFAFRDRIDDFLRDQHLIEHWGPSGANANGNQLRTAPFVFTIVCVEPVVVMMTPHDFSRAKAIYDVTGSKNGLPTRYMVNDYKLDTAVPYAAKMLFFLPETGIGPSEVRWTGDEALIDLPRGELLRLVRRDSLVETRRERRP